LIRVIRGQRNFERMNLTIDEQDGSSLDRVVRRYTHRAGDENDPLLSREWLVTNGLGGYASGTVGGIATRRFHGVLIAALPAPHGRTMMLNRLQEHVIIGDSPFGLDAEVQIGGAAYPLREFALEAGLPVWTFDINGVMLRKRIWMAHRQNTVYVHYELVEGAETAKLVLAPAIHFRPHEGRLQGPQHEAYRFQAMDGYYEVRDGTEHFELKLCLWAKDERFHLHPHKSRELLYGIEEERGYDCRGDLYIPGEFEFELTRHDPVTLIASTEDLEVMQAMTPHESYKAEMERRRKLLAQADPRAQSGASAELVLAADQFLITPSGRLGDVARAHASGDEIKTIIAGYHWFTDWGRDTMISLEGLTLTSGRVGDAGNILRTFAHYVHDGLIPNMFPEAKNEGLYNTADATLWFFHAISRYLAHTNDRPTLRLLLPKLLDIADHHLRGTKFNIGVDPNDGLLRQGAEGYQLTWMDAKVGDWVVTPRHGKTVEINALWYNALKLLEEWLQSEREGSRAEEMAQHAERCRASFNARFWNPQRGYLFDVVDCDGESGKNDDACRPNQLLSFSLDHPVLERQYWQPVFDTCCEMLLTPFGLRSLSRDHPDYKAQYHGDLRTRDAAYHQGTVWSWVIGPFVDCWVKLHPEDKQTARDFLGGLVAHLDDACIGSVSEVFDAEPPYHPRGCCAQAWGVAELLRCLALTAQTGSSSRPQRR
jgi:predicted glycogen debranching enzyme